MKILNNTPEITFDDILLLPQKSVCLMEEERQKISLKTKVTKKISLDIPIVSSYMPGVTEDEMAITMAKLGGLGLIHGFQSFERQLNQIKNVKNQNLLVAASVGEQSKKSLKHIENLLTAGTDIISFNTYSADNKPMFEFIQLIKKTYPKVQLNVGPIATKSAVKSLAKLGVDSINVGIGPGSHCTTRLVTGVGRPQLSAIAECAKEANKYNIPIIGEGGIKHPGDIPKALAFGASTVMIGGLLSGTKEAPGPIIRKKDTLYKSSWGMCSDTTMTFQHLEVKKIYASILKEVKTIIKKYFFLEKYIDSYIENKTFFEEGTGGLVEYKGSVIQIIDDLVNGTRRSMWYQGVNSIPELQKKAIAVKTSSNTNAENMPRI